MLLCGATPAPSAVGSTSSTRSCTSARSGTPGARSGSSLTSLAPPPGSRPFPAVAQARGVPQAQPQALLRRSPAQVVQAVAATAPSAALPLPPAPVLGASAAGALAAPAACGSAGALGGAPAPRIVPPAWPRQLGAGGCAGTGAGGCASTGSLALLGGGSCGVPLGGSPWGPAEPGRDGEAAPQPGDAHAESAPVPAIVQHYERVLVDVGRHLSALIEAPECTSRRCWPGAAAAEPEPAFVRSEASESRGTIPEWLPAGAPSGVSVATSCGEGARPRSPPQQWLDGASGTAAPGAWEGAAAAGFAQRQSRPCSPAWGAGGGAGAAAPAAGAPPQGPVGAGPPGAAEDARPADGGQRQVPPQDAIATSRSSGVSTELAAADDRCHHGLPKVSESSAGADDPGSLTDNGAGDGAGQGSLPQHANRDSCKPPQHPPGVHSSSCAAGDLTRTERLLQLQHSLPRQQPAVEGTAIPPRAAAEPAGPEQQDSSAAAGQVRQASGAALGKEACEDIRPPGPVAPGPCDQLRTWPQEAPEHAAAAAGSEPCHQGAGARLTAARARERAGGAREGSPQQLRLDGPACRKEPSEPAAAWRAPVDTGASAASTNVSGASTTASASAAPTDAADALDAAASCVGSERIRSCLRAEIERLQRQSRIELRAEACPEAAAPAHAPAASPRQDPLSGCLEQVLAELASERSEREAVAAAVVRLEKRLAEGVASISEVAAARVATDSATDTMMGALRGCVDELRDQCGWPPKSATPWSRQLASTMGEAIVRQQREIEELRGYVESARAQQDEQQRHARALASRMDEMEEHTKRVDREVAALEKSCSSRQSKLEFSVQALQESVAKLRVCKEESDSVVGLTATVQAVQSQLRNIQGECGQFRSAVAALSEQQQRLQQAPTPARQATAAKHDTEMMQALCSVLERQQQLQDAHQRQESDLAALRGALLEGEAGEGSAAPAAPAAERASGAEQAASGSPAPELPGVRPRTSAAPTAADAPAGRAEAARQVEPLGALQAELGAVAGSVSRLAAQVEHLRSCRSSPCSSLSPHATPHKPSLSGAPAQSPAAQEPQGSQGAEVCRQLSAAMEAAGSPAAPPAIASGPGPTAACAVEGAQALREQLAVLMAKVRQLPPAGEPPGGAGGEVAGSMGKQDAGKQQGPAVPPGFDTLQARVSSCVPSASGEKKAPSPRKWLTEPLAVAVGRFSSGTPGSLASSPRSVINAAGA